MTPVTFLLLAITFTAVIGFIVYKKNTKFKSKFDAIEEKIEKKIDDITEKIQ
jgi:F0F1-type ATP synthase membrane subunit b/b'